MYQISFQLMRWCFLSTNAISFQSAGISTKQPKFWRIPNSRRSMHFFLPRNTCISNVLKTFKQVWMVFLQKNGECVRFAHCIYCMQYLDYMQEWQTGMILHTNINVICVSYCYNNLNVSKNRLKIFQVSNIFITLHIHNI